MNVLAHVLEEREDGARSTQEADDTWLRERTGVDPAERREAWRRWLRRTLERALQWPGDEAARARLIGQAMAEVTTLARQLRGRGWLLDGEALAGHVRALLAPVAAAQRAGKVGDFWPYFRAAVRRYVGANAEEIQRQAKRTGSDEGAQTIGGVMASLGIGAALRRRGPSLVEIVAARGAEIGAGKVAKAEADGAQLKLL